MVKVPVASSRGKFKDWLDKSIVMAVPGVRTSENSWTISPRSFHFWMGEFWPLRLMASRVKLGKEFKTSAVDTPTSPAHFLQGTEQEKEAAYYRERYWDSNLGVLSKPHSCLRNSLYIVSRTTICSYNFTKNSWACSWLIFWTWVWNERMLNCCSKESSIGWDILHS